MIKNVASHQEYQAFVKEYLSVLFLARGQLSVLLLYKDMFAKLCLTDFYPEFSFARFLLDSAHDAYAIYRLLRHYGVDAFIDLNKRNEGNVVYKDDISLNTDGIPICSGGHIMAYHGLCYGRMRHKWRCPKSRKPWGVVCDRNCSSSDYGQVLLTAKRIILGSLPGFPATRLPGRVFTRGVRVLQYRYERENYRHYKLKYYFMSLSFSI